MTNRYKEKDIEWSMAGDIVLNDGDFKLTTSLQCVKQDAYNRIKTNNPDWYRHRIGSDLEDLFGEDNTRLTAGEGIDKITHSLTHDGRFSTTDIEIDAVPISKQQINFFVFIKTGLKKPLVIKHEVYL